MNIFKWSISRKEKEKEVTQWYTFSPGCFPVLKLLYVKLLHINILIYRTCIIYEYNAQHFEMMPEAQYMCVDVDKNITRIHAKTHSAS